MPELDEDTIRELMFRSTDDLFASPAAAATAIKRQRRRHLRGRVLGVAGTAAAAGLAAGVLASGTGPSTSGGPSASGGVHLVPSGIKSSATPIRLTAAQKELFRLSVAAANTPRPSGRYVVLKEIATTKDAGGGVTSSEIGGKTSVIDTITGGGVTYQDITVSGPAGPQPPGVLNAPAGSSPTVAQLDALPTDPVALRATLLAQAEQQLRQAQQIMNQNLKKLRSRFRAIAVPKYHQTADDLVFEQATNLLWEPDLSPQLRSALYQVLAATPGVLVSTDVKDSSGRPATEISRVTSAVGDKAEVFENPATGATLESAWSFQAGEFDEDLYQSITYTNTIPPDPYQT
jgi:hypothetical protein